MKRKDINKHVDSTNMYLNITKQTSIILECPKTPFTRSALFSSHYLDRKYTVYASACVMTCAMKLDYSEEEVRSVNLTHSSSPNCAQCVCV